MVGDKALLRWSLWVWEPYFKHKFVDKVKYSGLVKNVKSIFRADVLRCHQDQRFMKTFYLFIFPFEMCVFETCGLGLGSVANFLLSNLSLSSKAILRSCIAMRIVLMKYFLCYFIFIFTLHDSVTRDCTFRWCMVTNLSFSESSLKENFHNQVQSQCHFVTLCILLLLRLSRRTQNNDQHADLSTGYGINSV